MLGLLLFIGIVILLGLAAALHGADTRDGRDWTPACTGCDPEPRRARR